MSKLTELRYKKKPIVLEFYTEYSKKHLDGVLLVSRYDYCFRNR
jgi:hypothetical protein